MNMQDKLNSSFSRIDLTIPVLVWFISGKMEGVWKQLSHTIAKAAKVRQLIHWQNKTNMLEQFQGIVLIKHQWRTCRTLSLCLAWKLPLLRVILTWPYPGRWTGARQEASRPDSSAIYNYFFWLQKSYQKENWVKLMSARSLFKLNHLLTRKSYLLIICPTSHEKLTKSKIK